MTGDRRKLSDEDIQAFIVALNENESHCRFIGIDPQRLSASVEFTEALIAGLNDSKKTVRNVLIKLAIYGIVGLILLGAGLKIKEVVKP